MNLLSGNLLDASEGIIVHGCNAQGKMASGVARDIRARYPQAYDAYMAHYQAKGLKLGEVVWAKISDEPKLAIANGITQEFYGRDASRRYVDYPAVAQVFRAVAKVAHARQLPVHYPKIGAGLGGGDWGVIEKIINEELAGLNHTLWVPPEPLAASRPSP